jgi:hypothetical protein
MTISAIVTASDLDPETLPIIGGKVVAQDPTRSPNYITIAPVAPAAIESGDSVNQALNKLQAQLNQESGQTRYRETIGDGTSTSFVISHSLNTKDVIVHLYDVSNGLSLAVDVSRISVDQVKIDFQSAPASQSKRVLILS